MRIWKRRVAVLSEGCLQNTDLFPSLYAVIMTTYGISKAFVNF